MAFTFMIIFLILPIVCTLATTLIGLAVKSAKSKG